jgi:peptide/nickel transport system ATP-binding protein
MMPPQLPNPGASRKGLWGDTPQSPRHGDSPAPLGTGQPPQPPNPGGSPSAATSGSPPGLGGAARGELGGGGAAPLLDVRDLSKAFPVRGGWLGRARGAVRAVDGVSFAIEAGSTLGRVGESGCGKSTTARLVLRLIEPDGGSVAFDGRDVAALSGSELRALRREMQIVFQDPYSSLNPQMCVRDLIGFNLRVHGEGGGAVDAAVDAVLDDVGLARGYAARYPHELSGGQRQRVNLARALVVRPRLLIADEPVSALDKSVQAQVLNLFVDLRARYGLTALFISHDLNVVEYLSDWVAVMYLGQIVEWGRADAVYARPLHPYTQALMAASPDPDRPRGQRTPPLAGDLPSPLDPPSGCRFRTRCPRAMPICAEQPPRLALQAVEHTVACHLYSGAELGVQGQQRSQYSALHPAGGPSPSSPGVQGSAPAGGLGVSPNHLTSTPSCDQ